MNIIPVIDLMDGAVVHAKHGDRKNYQPIQSALCDSSTPNEIVSNLVGLYPFKQLYIADINAIQGRGNHLDIIDNIRRSHAQIEIWLDAGSKQYTAAVKMGVVPVIGSESITNMAEYHALQHHLSAHQHVLSLDWLDDRFLGPLEILEHPESWPTYVIAMTLSKVGSGAGPDITRLKQLQLKHQQVYAAGGVRHADDLQALADQGISGALVASAIHNGSLTNSEIGCLVQGSDH